MIPEYYYLYMMYRILYIPMYVHFQYVHSHDIISFIEVIT